MNKDKHRFEIWTDEDRLRKWDANTTIQELLLSSKGELLDPFEAIQEGINSYEEGYNYSYGGVLSGRGGIFVVHRDDRNKIIRSRQDWMS